MCFIRTSTSLPYETILEFYQLETKTEYFDRESPFKPFFLEINGKLIMSQDLIL
jgi:hypothetical protein